MATYGSVDNLLHFVESNFDSLDRQCLESLLVSFYNLDELLTSKFLLISECKKIDITSAISDFIKKRLNTKSEVDVKHKVSKDILDIWTYVDTYNGGQFLTTFVASDPPHLPPPSSFRQSSTTSASASATTPTATTTTTTADISVEHSIQHVITLLQSLRDDFDKQQESISWLTNIAKNTFRHVKSITDLDSTVGSGLNESLLDSPNPSSPRSLPRVPSRKTLGILNREKLIGKRKCLDVSSPPFIPFKQAKAAHFLTSSSTAAAISTPEIRPLPPLSISKEATVAAAKDSSASATTAATIPSTDAPLPQNSTAAVATVPTSAAAAAVVIPSTPTSRHSSSSATTTTTTTAAIFTATNAPPPHISAAAAAASVPAAAATVIPSTPSPCDSLASVTTSTTTTAISTPTNAPLPLISTPAAAEVAAADSVAPVETNEQNNLEGATSLVTLPPPPPLVESTDIEETSTLSLPPPRRFADRVERLRDNGNEWRIAGGNKRPKKPSVIGTDSAGGLKGVPSRTLSFWQYSVTYLDGKTTNDDVRKNLHKHGIEVREIWMLNSQVKGTRTAKIRVAREHKDRAKNPSIWPLHSRIQDWDFGRKKRENGSQSSVSQSV